MHPSLQYAMAQAHRQDLGDQAHARALATGVSRRSYRVGRVRRAALLATWWGRRAAASPRRSGSAALA